METVCAGCDMNTDAACVSSSLYIRVNLNMSAFHTEPGCIKLDSYFSGIVMYVGSIQSPVLLYKEALSSSLLSSFYSGIHTPND